MEEQFSNNYEIAISEEQLHERITALGRQISQDYEGRVVHCVCVLENGFLFLADLVRAMTCDVRCQFVKPYVRELDTRTEIFYAPEVDVEGEHVLLCEGILSTGHTTDFLARNFEARGAASVAICGLLDRPSDRRVDLTVAYTGFQVGSERLAGFGMGMPMLKRNLPFIFSVPDTHNSGAPA
jgi:hypoxanthine phosphoribosyltransferase